MIEFLTDYWEWLFGTSLVMFFGTLAVVPWLLVRLPADYFVRESPPPQPPGWLVLRWTVRIIKNLVGLVCLLAGLAMLVLPGQGLLTIFIGISLLDFPGKRALERRIIQRPRILRSINWLRRKNHRPPLQFDEAVSEPEEAAAGSP